MLAAGGADGKAARVGIKGEGGSLEFGSACGVACFMGEGGG